MNCSFNIRYKPRTTRQFTKSDLTVYDSAGNTALNALTVYGKSEVVDGAIASAGEGWATVDLGTLTWGRDTTTRPADGATIHAFYATISPMKQTYSIANLLMAGYMPQTTAIVDYGGRDTVMDKICGGADANSRFWIYNAEYNDYTTEQFKAAMSGVLLCYKLADPTQGNCIAVKTDNGTGIDGTMAVFSTGTPLRGIPDTDVRDVMTWDGTSGEVVTRCALYSLYVNWQVAGEGDNCFYTGLPNTTTGKYCIINGYTKVTTVEELVTVNKSYLRVGNLTLIIHNTAFTTPEECKNGMIDKYALYELATPIIQPLTTAENDSIAGLRTFSPQTHAQNNAQTEMTVDYTIRVPTI